MKCRFCDSEMGYSDFEFYKRCSKCNIFFHLGSNYELMSYSKFLNKDGVRYVAQYYLTDDLVLLFEDGKRIGEIKGEHPLDSILSKASVIKVFS